VHSTIRSTVPTVIISYDVTAEIDYTCRHCGDAFSSEPLLMWHYGNCESLLFKLIDAALTVTSMQNSGKQAFQDLIPLIMQFSWPCIVSPPPSELNLRYAAILDTMTWIKTPRCRGCIINDDMQHNTSCTIIWAEYQELLHQKAEEANPYNPVHLSTDRYLGNGLQISTTSVPLRLARLRETLTTKGTWQRILEASSQVFYKMQLQVKEDTAGQLHLARTQSQFLRDFLACERRMMTPRTQRVEPGPDLLSNFNVPGLRCTTGSSDSVVGWLLANPQTVIPMKEYIKVIPLSKIPDKFKRRLNSLAELTMLYDQSMPLGLSKKQKRDIRHSRAEELRKSKDEIIRINALNIDGPQFSPVGPRLGKKMTPSRSSFLLRNLSRPQSMSEPLEKTDSAMNTVYERDGRRPRPSPSLASRKPEPHVALPSCKPLTSKEKVVSFIQPTPDTIDTPWHLAPVAIPGSLTASSSLGHPLHRSPPWSQRSSYKAPGTLDASHLDSDPSHARDLSCRKCDFTCSTDVDMMWHRAFCKSTLPVCSDAPQFVARPKRFQGSCIQKRWAKFQ
jgi:hypothetical protein